MKLAPRIDSLKAMQVYVTFLRRNAMKKGNTGLHAVDADPQAPARALTSKTQQVR
jgi:hypothetical protein